MGILQINKHNEIVDMYMTFDLLYLDITKLEKTTTAKNIDVYSPKQYVLKKESYKIPVKKIGITKLWLNNSMPIYKSEIKNI